MTDEVNIRNFCEAKAKEGDGAFAIAFALLRLAEEVNDARSGVSSSIDNASSLIEHAINSRG